MAPDIARDEEGMPATYYGGTGSSAPAEEKTTTPSVTPTLSIDDLIKQSGQSTTPSTPLPQAAGDAFIPEMERYLRKGIQQREAAENDPERRAIIERMPETVKQSQDRQNVTAQAMADGLQRTADELKPFKGPEETTPLQKFGSLGMTFAMLASRHTHQPMINTMLASSAVLDAIKANDKEKYERAKTEWKDNLQIALTRNALQQQSLGKVLEIAAAQPAQAMALANAHAAKYGDPQVAAMAAQDLGKLQQLYNQREKNAYELAGMRQGLEQQSLTAMNAREEQVLAEEKAVNAIKQQYPNATNEQLFQMLRTPFGQARLAEAKIAVQKDKALATHAYMGQGAGGRTTDPYKIVFNDKRNEALAAGKSTEEANKIALEAVDNAHRNRMIASAEGRNVGNLEYKANEHEKQALKEADQIISYAKALTATDPESAASILNMGLSKREEVMKEIDARLNKQTSTTLSQGPTPPKEMPAPPKQEVSAPKPTTAQDVASIVALLPNPADKEMSKKAAEKVTELDVAISRLDDLKKAFEKDPSVVGAIGTIRYGAEVPLGLLGQVQPAHRFNTRVKEFAQEAAKTISGAQQFGIKAQEAQNKAMGLTASVNPATFGAQLEDLRASLEIARHELRQKQYMALELPKEEVEYLLKYRDNPEVIKQFRDRYHKDEATIKRTIKFYGGM